MSGLCVGEYPSEANITLYNNVLNENITKSISLPNQLSKVQVIEVNNVTHLQRFTNYTVVVTYSNLAADFDLGSTLNFSKIYSELLLFSFKHSLYSLQILVILYLLVFSIHLMIMMVKCVWSVCLLHSVLLMLHVQ